MLNLKKLVTILSLSAFLAVSLPNAAYANEAGTEEDDGIAIVADLVLLRPLGIVGTVLGVAFFVVALPFSIPSGTVGKTFTALVKEPAKFTFTRDLGQSP
jgi:hypothetical protein